VILGWRPPVVNLFLTHSQCFLTSLLPRFICIHCQYLDVDA